MNQEYRIQEFNGHFTIQVRIFKTKGTLWWKKKEISWIRANAFGGPMVYGRFMPPCSKEYTTLEKAMRQVALWKKGRIYHSCYDVNKDDRGTSNISPKNRPTPPEDRKQNWC